MDHHAGHEERAPYGEASLPGLADMARVSLKECEAAMVKLEGKDKYSRNQDHEGRRIERCQADGRS